MLVAIAWVINSIADSLFLLYVGVAAVMALVVLKPMRTKTMSRN